MLKTLPLKEMKNKRQLFQENLKKIRRHRKTIMKKKSKERNVDKMMVRRVVSLSYQKASMVMKNLKKEINVSSQHLSRRRKRSKSNKASSVPYQKYWMIGRR